MIGVSTELKSDRIRRASNACSDWTAKFVWTNQLNDCNKHRFNDRIKLASGVSPWWQISFEQISPVIEVWVQISDRNSGASDLSIKLQISFEQSNGRAKLRGPSKCSATAAYLVRRKQFNNWGHQFPLNYFQTGHFDTLTNLVWTNRFNDWNQVRL